MRAEVLQHIASPKRKLAQMFSISAKSQIQREVKYFGISSPKKLQTKVAESIRLVS